MQVNPKKIIIIIGLAAFMSSCSTAVLNQGDQNFNTGKELFNNGDCEGSKLKFEEALKQDPEQWKAYLYIAECALKDDDYKRMLPLLHNALPHASKNSPEGIKLKTLLTTGGHGALKKNDFDNAILFYKDYITLEQESSIPHLLLGNAFLERGLQGDMKSAIIEFKAGMNKSNNSEKDIKQIRDYLMARANKYSLQGDSYSESRCYLAYTENFNSKDSEAYIALSRILLEMDNPSGALYYAKKAYALDPKKQEVIELMLDLNTPIQH